MKRVNIYKCTLVREKSVLYDGACNRPDAIAQIAIDMISDSCDEQFIAFALNNRGYLAGVHPISIGTTNSCIVEPRSVFRPCILNNATGIVVAHNHPTGDTTPSEEDIATTTRLIECGNILGIPVYDHIIVGFGGTYTSFHERGLI